MQYNSVKIFYDFETSSRELLGQILSYYFCVIAPNGDVIEECEGIVKPSRTQLIDHEAILVNKLNIKSLVDNGELEIDVANKIYTFLKKWVENAHETTLVGFNSNNFDLNFLRNCLIRYGYNPFFFGKLKNIDVLHFVRTIAVNYPSEFPWTVIDREDRDPFYTFKLEKCCQSFNLISDAQTHDAKEDVLLTMKLVNYLEERFNTSLDSFEPFYLNNMTADYPFGKQRVIGSPVDDSPVKNKKWWLLDVSGKSILALDLDLFIADIDYMKQLSTQDYIDYVLNNHVFYKNMNKHHFQLDEMTYDESEYIVQLLNDSGIDKIKNQLSLNSYFRFHKKKQT